MISNVTLLQLRGKYDNIQYDKQCNIATITGKI